MRFNLDSSRRDEIREAPKETVRSEHLAETEAAAENFDDCASNEVRDRNGNEVNAASLEEAEETFDDCEARMEELEEKHPELAEDDDDFSDCGKETGGQYVAEVTYSTDGEISQLEAHAELQEAYHECDDPGDMQQLKENANENEHIEVHTAEVVERPAGGEANDTFTEDQYEQAQAELDEAQEELDAQQEAAQTYQTSLENQIRKQEEQVPEETKPAPSEEAEHSDEIREEAEPSEREKDQDAADVQDETGSSLKPEAEAPEKTEDAETLTAPALKALRDAHSAALQKKIEEKNCAEAELKAKFDDVMSREKGSVECRQALQKYNALHDKKNDLSEQITAMEQQQDRLDKKSIELRDAQIQKGLDAAAASDASLAEAAVLQERYDQTYYDAKPDKAVLAGIREDSCTAIAELSAEKESIKRAMDAKMDEISEYVISHRMERYDTAHDLQYQQMSAAYTAMKEVCDRLGYSIVKLDENNKAITEQLGDEYASMVNRPPHSELSAVNDGTDVPGEINYFIDETKAADSLSPFRQSNWEQLTLQEQKQAIEKLAGYNAEILGVEERPRIVYYHAEDPSEYGGYSARQNAIYINESNMHDAVETADTISHEYRHKYQHERAEKLETERDLAFKDGFDNYIRAEDDYQGYTEQLVEADARAYAQAVKEQIDSYAGQDAGNITPRMERGTLAAGYTELNPKTGAVFEKITVDELPDDFEQKDRLRCKEVLEAEELDSLRGIAKVYYENGRQLAKKIQEFSNYKEHYDIISGHIEKVRVKALEAADALELHFRQNDYDSLYAPNIDRRTVEVMAVYHDTGMDGNLDVEAFHGELSAKQIRNAHPVQSAIHALRDRGSIEQLQISADEVALGCLLHSKSSSGVTDLSDAAQWAEAIQKLEAGVDAFNRTHPDEQIHFDRSFLLNEDGSFRQEKLAEMRSEAAALRIGDANGHDTNSRASQNGKALSFTLEAKAVEREVLREVERKVKTGCCKPFFREIQAADVTVGEIELNNISDPDGVSRMYAVGEGNFKSLSCEADQTGTIRQVFELCDANAFPLSTQNCIKERLGEYATARPIRYTPEIRLGSKYTKETYDSYHDFARRMKDEYGVKLEVI